MKEVAALAFLLLAFGVIVPEGSQAARQYTFTFKEMGIETRKVFLIAAETGNFTVESPATRCNATVRLRFATKENMTATLTINGEKETVTLRPAQGKRNVTLSPPLQHKNTIEVSLTTAALTTAFLYGNSTLTVYPIEGEEGSPDKQSKMHTLLTGVGIGVLTLPIFLLIFLTRRKKKQLDKKREREEVYIG